MLAQLHKDFPKDVRIVYRHFPLSFHDKSLLASQAAEAAGLQGKFWEMHDAIFSGQSTWAGQTPDQFEGWLETQAKGLGLDATRFMTDLKSAAVVAKVKQAQADALKLGIGATPTLIFNGSPWFGAINGQEYNSPIDYGNLSALVSLELLQKRQFTNCPPPVVDPQKQYSAILKTEKGDITIRLFLDKAPMAVNSFVFLAKNGWFDGVTFHRVLPDSVAQSGDPSGTGLGSPGYTFSVELDPDLKFDKPGVVGMANAGPDTNGSQFFITYAPLPNLDGKYTIFGQVTQGMDVVQKLSPRDPSKGGGLPPGDKILSVTIVEK